MKIDRDLCIEDLIALFGPRIKRAIYFNGEIPESIISTEIYKICRWWKFWNRDIKRAYTRYSGMILFPWTTSQMTHLSSYESLSEEKSQEIIKKYKNLLK